MKRLALTLAIAGLTLGTFASASFAAGTQDRTRTPDRKRDRDCKIVLEEQYGTSLAGNGDCKRDRKRDRSCDRLCDRYQAANNGKRTGPRDGSGPRRDGSCG